MTTFSAADIADMLGRNPDLTIDDPGSLIAGPGELARRAVQSEAAMQQAVFAEADRRALVDARWGLLTPIVNGQYRKGQRPEPGLSRAAGLPDLLLPLACRGFVSAWLELKVGRNVLSAKQKSWHRALREHGHFVAVVYDDPQTAIDVLAWYLSGARK